MAPEFNPFSPEFRADPYPSLAALRAEDPVHFVPVPGMWLLTRYADVAGVLRDDERFSSRRALFDRIAAAVPDGKPPRCLETARTSMLAQDPPQHTRLRNLVNKAFTPRVVDELRPGVERIVSELLDRAEAAGWMDLVADLAVPLPLYVIAELLGMPADDRPLLKRWSDDLAILVDGTIALERLGPAEQSYRELESHLKDAVAVHRRTPGSDLISGLLAAQAEGDGLSDEEILRMCVLLFVAGHETTTGLIGNGTLALLRHPAAAAELRAEPALMRSAIEELARHDAPVQLVTRTARVDVTIDGRTITKGQEVVCLLGAANRDPARFPDPDRLDLRRPDNRHLAFGHGIHFCLGAPLARLEGQIALHALVQRFPRARLVDETIVWRDGFVLRSPKTLPLLLR